MFTLHFHINIRSYSFGSILSNILVGTDISNVVREYRFKDGFEEYLGFNGVTIIGVDFSILTEEEFCLQYFSGGIYVFILVVELEVK